ncbi:hypothetical protein Tco_0968903, partial [Tanacetum coccineum]
MLPIVRAPENLIWLQESGQAAYPLGDPEPRGVAVALPFLVPNAAKAEGGGRGKDWERVRRGRPSHISEVDWDAQIAFWNDPKNLARILMDRWKDSNTPGKKVPKKVLRYFPIIPRLQAWHWSVSVVSGASRSKGTCVGEWDLPCCSMGENGGKRGKDM